MKKQPIVLAEIFIVLTLLFLILTFVGLGIDAEVKVKKSRVPNQKILVVQQVGTGKLGESTIHSISVGGLGYTRFGMEGACRGLKQITHELRTLTSSQRSILFSQEIAQNDEYFSLETFDLASPDFFNNKMAPLGNCTVSHAATRLFGDDFSFFASNLQREYGIRATTAGGKNGNDLFYTFTSSNTNGFQTNISFWLCPAVGKRGQEKSEFDYDLPIFANQLSIKGRANLHARRVEYFHERQFYWGALPIKEDNLRFPTQDCGVQLRAEASDLSLVGMSPLALKLVEFSF